MKLLITGGAGFIGSALIRYLIEDTSNQIINIDKLSYASQLNALKSIEKNSRYRFFKINICDYENLSNIFNLVQPDAVMHLAAESHVDRSINSSKSFIDTNIIGTYNLLEISRNYWGNLTSEKKEKFRFLHVSTDEVFGDLESKEELFSETSPYKPSSPYSASKAASDHLVRAWGRTYGLPILLTNCSNNYGPFQFPEKLIPVTILNAANHRPINIYGDGSQIRDWLHVEDHVRALYLILKSGKIGESYNIGSNNELKNIDLVRHICLIMDELLNHSMQKSLQNLIQFTNDRPGHDKRYAINFSKINQELDWQPKINFSDGLRNTIIWYLKQSNKLLNLQTNK